MEAGGSVNAAAAPVTSTTTPPAPAADAAVITQRTWFGRCAVVFRDLKLHSGAGGAALPLEAVCAASRLMAESYGFMFGAKGMVTGVLNKDVEENTGGLERAAAKLRASAPQGALSTPALVEELLALECVGGGGPRLWRNCPRWPHTPLRALTTPLSPPHTRARRRCAGSRASPWRPLGARARSAR